MRKIIFYILEKPAKSFSFVLWRRWQFPGNGLIWLLYCTPRCHQRLGKLVAQYWQQLLKETKKVLPMKLKISNRKIDSCSISFRISSHKLIKLLWLPPPRKMGGEGGARGGRQTFRLIEKPVNWVLTLGLAHQEAYRKASKWTDSIFTAHLDLCFI